MLTRKRGECAAHPDVATMRSVAGIAHVGCPLFDDARRICLSRRALGRLSALEWPRLYSREGLFFSQALDWGLVEGLGLYAVDKAGEVAN